MKLRSIVITLLFALFAAVTISSAQEIVVVNGVKYRVHDVVKGETLYSLSRHYGVTVDEIIAANESLANGLKADTRIRIPLKGEAQQSEVAVASTPALQATERAETTADDSVIVLDMGNGLFQRYKFRHMIRNSFHDDLSSVI